MPRTQDPFQYTNWDSAPVLRKLMNDVKAHVEDAMHGDRANKQVVEPALTELAESCIRTLQELGMGDSDILEVVNRVFEEDLAPATA